MASELTEAQKAARAKAALVTLGTESLLRGNTALCLQLAEAAEEATVPFLAALYDHMAAPAGAQ